MKRSNIESMFHGMCDLMSKEIYSNPEERFNLPVEAISGAQKEYKVVITEQNGTLSPGLIYSVYNMDDGSTIYECVTRGWPNEQLSLVTLRKIMTVWKSMIPKP